VLCKVVVCAGRDVSADTPPLCCKVVVCAGRDVTADTPPLCCKVVVCAGRDVTADTTTSTAWKGSPYMQCMKTQFSTDSFISF